MRRSAWWALVAIAAGALATVALPAVRTKVHETLPRYWVQHLKAWRAGVQARYDIRIPMPDGVQLAASLYRPREAVGKLPTVLIRLPYNRLQQLETIQWAIVFARHGYAVVVQDVRGTYGSQGEFVPWRHATSDGVATLDWIAAQPWSNGRVGTFGCSALGELQFSLARARHPAHRAMVPSGAGGAMGSALGRHAYFGIYEGGILQLSSAFGFFVVHGAKRLDAENHAPVDYERVLPRLPVASLMDGIVAERNNFREFAATPLTDPWWQQLDYVSGQDRLATPALVLNTWGDQTVGETLALAEFARRQEPGLKQHVVIGPGNHCEHEAVGTIGEFGELTVRNAGQPYEQIYLQWFDHWLKEGGAPAPDLPPYLVYMVGEDQWLRSPSWPPPEAQEQRWYLGSGGAAAGSAGNGTLAPAPGAAGVDSYRADPRTPVPSIGGPLCCNADPRQRSGPADQRPIEGRADVLVYTSTPLATPLRIAGPLRARLWVDSSARDTDFVARLVHVFPDGRALTIQEGALRARYRDGIERPQLLQPQQTVELEVDMRAIAYTLPAGHRLRLHVASSSFPRLERNLQTGGVVAEEAQPVVALNRVHHGKDAPSHVRLMVMPPPK